MKGWKRLLHLLHLLHVCDLGITSQSIIMIIDALMKKKDLIVDKIARKVVGLEVDGMSSFLRHKIGVTT